MYSEYTFQSHYLTISGQRLHYIDEGKGPVIVMIHGNPTWSYYYRNLIHLLKDNFRVIALDHIGCGLSDKPQDYNYCLAQHIDNLQSLLNSLSISKCSLVVHDWGGPIGLGYAVRNIDNIESLVVLNTAAFRSQRIPKRIALCKIPIIGEILVRGLNGFAWPSIYMSVTTKMSKEIKEGYLAPYNSWRNRVAIHRFVRDIPLAETDPSYGALIEIEKGLSDIRDRGIPMMILWGGKDFCFDAVFYEEWISRFPDASHYYYDDLGHYILEDGIEELGPRIEAFFKEFAEVSQP